MDSEAERKVWLYFMKKKIGTLAAVLAAAVVLAACGDSDKEFLKDIKAEKYVTLGNYMGIEAAAAAPEVPEEEVDNYIRTNYLVPNAEQEEVTGRPIQLWDTASIDFAGYKDGEAFEGGTGSTDLVIGSGQFIAGFEEGLIGVNVGDTVKLDLTFPDYYPSNPDLAGAPVVFEVTVNGISAYPEITDEFVKGLGTDSFQTVQEMKDWVRELKEAEAQVNYESEIESALSDKIMAGCTFQKEPPEGLVNRFIRSVEMRMSAEAAQYGLQLADYMQMGYGLDQESYRAQFQSIGVEMAQRYIMYQAIADAEGLNPSEEEIQQEIDAMIAIYGYASEEALLQEIDRESIAEDLMRKKVVAFLMENGNIQAESAIVD